MGTSHVAVWGSIDAIAALAVLVALTGAGEQPPGLDVVIVPGRLEARVDAARPGAIVALFAGWNAGELPLPGGMVLGIESPILVDVTFANAHGTALFAVTFPIGGLTNQTVLTQAVAWDFARQLGDPAALALSPVRSAIEPPPQSYADIHVLFGQSNAEGHADAATLPASLRGPQLHCRIWNDAANRFEAMGDGDNTHTYGNAAWCGPELTLGNGLATAGGTVHLVKCAFAMTALGPTPGPWNEWGIATGEIYAILRFRIDRACAAARTHGLRPRIRGIFMMQGESDATNELQSLVYRTLLTELVIGMRQDLIHAELADNGAPIPFVIGAIDSRLPSIHFPFVARVRKAQRDVARDTIRCGLVDTTGFGLRSDGIHFDTAGVMSLGTAMAMNFHSL